MTPEEAQAIVPGDAVVYTYADGWACVMIVWGHNNGELLGELLRVQMMTRYASRFRLDGAVKPQRGTSC